MKTVPTLVAGIGNIFLADDGFGVEVIRRLAERPREGVCLVDFGIRGVDLTYALLEHERVILVDAAPRGRAPGTLYVIEPDLGALGEAATLAAPSHGIVVEHALSVARGMGARFRFVRVVGCEPGHIPSDDQVEVGLSAEVAAAIPGAVDLVEELLEAARTPPYDERRLPSADVR